MRTTKSFIAILFALLTAQAALAWYDPSTQRWLSRDPIGEPGFEALRIATQTASLPPSVSPQMLNRWIVRDPVPQIKNKKLFSDAPNRYLFVGNNPINFTDELGLTPYHGDYPPGNVPWNTPPFTPNNNPYGDATFDGKKLVDISNAFGNNILSNCIRGCLASAWDPCKKQYVGGLITAHALCVSICVGSLIAGGN